jgi:DNA replication protein
MPAFKGFSNAESFTEVPDSFFRELLNGIQDVSELKIVLFAMWGVQHSDGPVRGMREADFDQEWLGLTADKVHSGLERATDRGILLRVAHGNRVVYFLNSPRGRAAADALAQGETREGVAVVSAPHDRPNIFRLYEENIGPLTPLIADALNDAEETYSSQWTADAIGLAVKHNKRNWRYCEAILKRWKEQGRAEKQDRRDDQASRQRDIEDKIKKFVDG